jgi:hypothetical protein
MLKPVPYTESLDERRNQLLTLCKDIGIPEFYMHFPDEIGIELHHTSGGFFSRYFCGLVKESRPDLYRGTLPGMCIVRPDAELCPERQIEAWSTVALHEIAHCIESVCYGDDEPEPFVPEHSAALMAIDFKNDRADAAEVKYQLPPWAYHDWGFIRTMLHLEARFIEADVQVDRAAMFASSFYCLSPLDAYRDEIRSEIMERLYEPIPKALRGKPRASFIHLFADDMERHFEQQKREATQ